MKPLKSSDNVLGLKIAKGDADAFAELYDLYVAPIYRFIFFKVSNRQDAEDLTSEVFLKAWNHLTGTNEHVKNIRAYMYRMARNIVIDHYRRQGEKRLVHDEEVLASQVDERQQVLIRQIESQIEMKKVEQSLRRLKDEYREIILLKFVEELSISEIAKILDKSKGSVRVTLHRAIKVLKDIHKE